MNELLSDKGVSRTAYKRSVKICIFTSWSSSRHVRLCVCVFVCLSVCPKSPLAAVAATAAGRDKKKKLKRFLFKSVSVLLSASVERVGVSRMRDFYLN